MPDAVWPTAFPRPTSSRNGFGRELKGFTRPDGSGGRFATCWVVAFGLPVVPLSRCYLSQERAFSTPPRGFRLRAATRYRIEGESRVRVAEVARTYAFCWLLVPAVVLAPLLVLLERVDGDDRSNASKAALVAAFLAVLVGSILVLTALLAAYRARWAPVRTVVWVDPPAGGRRTR
ncbi:hypothetical protein [Phytohabitans suffuscus]|uniref:Uncharacterized protein n=1 Tax=Phytohabitans suffuscus TaxID=624315 RepID=A0A6F8YXJ6_9ACTN|nr:hypothetical protein [Phytohabitans suffuscus]BCB90774.1 hypothetical protein Psuf_080870 [Phytohabitans suffuscus]